MLAALSLTVEHVTNRLSSVRVNFYHMQIQVLRLRSPAHDDIISGILIFLFFLRELIV